MHSQIREYIQDGIQKVKINTNNGAELVGNFHEGSLKKGILFFPGFTEPKESFQDFTERLCMLGFNTWAFDINSQGESSGNWDLSQMVESVHEIQKVLRQKYNLEKVGAFGNSMGGMAVGITAAKDTSSLDCLCLTTTGTEMYDYFPKNIAKIIKYLPQSLFRQLTILFDTVESSSNEIYRNKSHLTFKTKEGYQPYAQFGALRIHNLKEFMGWIENSPKLMDYANKIIQPVLFIYGGKDRFLGIKDCRLPKRIETMYDSIRSNQKELIVAPGADHSLNTKTRTDECFNQDLKYKQIKNKIIEHFSYHLL